MRGDDEGRGRRRGDTDVLGGVDRVERRHRRAREELDVVGHVQQERTVAQRRGDDIREADTGSRVVGRCRGRGRRELASQRQQQRGGGEEEAGCDEQQSHHRRREREALHQCGGEQTAESAGHGLQCEHHRQAGEDTLRRKHARDVLPPQRRRNAESRGQKGVGDEQRGHRQEAWPEQQQHAAECQRRQREGGIGGDGDGALVGYAAGQVGGEQRQERQGTPEDGRHQPYLEGGAAGGAHQQRQKRRVRHNHRQRQADAELRPGQSRGVAGDQGPFAARRVQHRIAPQ